MRISDWSSDVCSSDLAGVAHQLGDLADAADILDPVSLCEAEVAVEPVTDIVAVEQEAVPVHPVQLLFDEVRDRRFARPRKAGEPERSEEHTSELQSLMRISYAVFCLKKNRRKKTIYSQSIKRKEINT